MDVEMADAHAPSHAQQSRRYQTVVVDDNHPFDLDSYMANYTGRAAIDRLTHIIASCPSLANEAVQLALQHIYQSRDPSQYQAVLSAHEQVSSVAPIAHLPPLDTRWADETMSKNQQERSKLEVELKTYTNNMIKESIRMGQRDLGNYYRATGDYSSALKHYTKSREFCTTSQHVLDMCLSVLELLIEQRNYSHLPTYVFKAEAALDAASAAASAQNESGPSAPASKKPAADRDRTQSKLDFATALSHLGQGNFEKAGYYFTRLGPPSDLGSWLGKLVGAGDIAIYGTICALASLSRSGFRVQVLENPGFSVYIEQEPYIRELVEAYMGSNFRVALDILNKYSSRHYLDIHLSPHIRDLLFLVRNKAMVLYFQPFSSIRLDRMGSAFGWSLDQVEQHIVGLIQSGDIQGRIDSQNKILYAKKTDHRADLFARAIKAGTSIESTDRKLLYRMRLQQAELVIKAPKSQYSTVDLLLQD